MNKYIHIVKIVFLLFLLSSCKDDRIEEIEKKKEAEGLYFPPLEGSEWETKSPQDLGWNLDALKAAVQYAKENNSYNLIILYKGRIVSENYWEDNTVTTGHHIASASKSMTAFLIGILQQNYNFSINDPFNKYLTPGWSKAPLAKENLITIRNAMTMTTGLDFELNYLADAGKKWNYNNTTYELLLTLYPIISGLTNEEFSAKHLFSRIGMNNSVWEGPELRTTARDMARFGLMILAEGKWKDEKIIQDQDYFKEMLSTSQSINESYGYLWWLNGKNSSQPEDIRIEGPLHPYMPLDALLALGKNDQRIEVIPSLDIVVVRQGLSSNLPEFYGDSYDDNFWKLLYPAIPEKTETND